MVLLAPRSADIDYITCPRCGTVNLLEPTGTCAGRDSIDGTPCRHQWYLLGAPERFPRLYEHAAPIVAQDARIPDPQDPRRRPR